MLYVMNVMNVSYEAVHYAGLQNAARGSPPLVGPDILRNSHLK
jgi:hypothetical protein